MSKNANFSKEIFKVGANFVVGLSGTELGDDERKLLERLQPSGIILFANNLRTESSAWPDQLITLIADARAACGREGLLVSIDHEGGPVHRFRDPVTHFSAARDWPRFASDVGAAMGRELRSLGFNLDFAPVLDIATHPQNTVIGRRAFGETPEIVAQAAALFRNGLEAQGVIACGKHFPGHGGTIADSHFELPVLNASLAEMEKTELVPFRRLIEDGIQMIMTAHVHYPTLDKNRPATLSKEIIQKLLRTHLGFSGVVISDALEMNALASFSRTQAAAEAIGAGVDLLLVAQPKNTRAIDIALEMARGLLESLERGEITEPQLQESHKRIQRLLTYGKELRQRARSSDFPPSLLGCTAHQQLAERIIAQKI